MDKSNLTKEEKIALLKNFLVDDICVKAIIDTLSPQELDNWIETNLDTMLIQSEVAI